MLDNNNLKIRSYFFVSHHQEGWLFIASGCRWYPIFLENLFFSGINICVERLRMLNFVSSRFIYLVMTILLDLYFACEGGGLSPLKQSEIVDQNLQVTLYNLASQNFGGKQFLKLLDLVWRQINQWQCAPFASNI